MFNERLINMRHCHGYEIEQVSRFTGIKADEIKSYEAGAQPPALIPMQHIEQLADLYNVNTAYLVTGRLSKEEELALAQQALPQIATADEQPAQGIDKTLQERGSRYGEFSSHAKITQSLKRAMQTNTNWQTLTDSQKECLEMIAHKVGRILNGDPNYSDSWHDIIGYTRLVELELTEQ